jgi:uncharacterized membrane protein YsdA (DUF1294 family)
MVLGIFNSYLVGVNVLSFLSFGYDKYNSKRGKRRIPERWLHMLTSSGGFVGSVAGMSLFRHKTKKFKFVIITVLITMIESWLLYNYCPMLLFW